MSYRNLGALVLLLLASPVVSGVRSSLAFENPQQVLRYDLGHEPQSSRIHKCTLRALGGDQDDSDNLVKAVEQCGTNGVITLPDPIYNIGKVLNLTLSNCYVDLHGFLKYSDDIEYWIHNVWTIPALQNQSLGLSFLGNDFVLDGNNVGGVDGNGQVWYTWSKGAGNVPGRPMTLSLVEAKNVIVKDFSVIQPQFWAHLTVDAENVLYKNCYVNATNSDPDASGDPKSWLLNTDGADTWRSHNITFENFVYQGGDDCISFKPNSTMITVRNVTCVGTTGLAFGSIGQYPGVTDIIEDVYIEDAKFYPSPQCLGFRAIEFKSWVGVPYGIPPNGGGGGSGYGRNVTIKNVYVEDIYFPIYLQSDLTYTASQRGLHEDTSKFLWSDIHLYNFTGTAAGDRIVDFTCSKSAPCFDITFEDINIKPRTDRHPELNYVCNNVVLGPNDGLNECHPGNSSLQTVAPF
ncbi:MAG: hypothetical protein TREMPRED_004728 [Tremellales sp. Tagirdzhanova-0007]|nr:MAG: hypothetical protein TREMPRED_004728 [Tremellales sp. Tagirdzhanova-0007]